MHITPIKFDFRPDTGIKKITLSTFLVSLVAIGIIFAAAYHFQFHPLYTCIPGGTGFLSLLIYMVQSCHKKWHEPENKNPKIIINDISEIPQNPIVIEEYSSEEQLDPVVDSESTSEVVLSLPSDLTGSTIIESEVVPSEPIEEKITEALFETPQESGEELHVVIPSTEINCGNKFNGIREIHDWLKEEPIDGVEVPLPKGISHEQVEAFLNQLAPAVFDKWIELGESFKKYRDEHGENKSVNFLEEPSVCQKLEEIRQEIETSFIRAAYVRGTRPFAAQLEPWLKEIRAKDAYLMVRSSGVEDSKECANAGGNLSEKYIRPELAEVLPSCGRVVASYFGEASLKNRLETGSNPFSSPPVLSVILHELIGESENQIPISVVLFIEPDYSEPGFPVTKISSTYGHGEGVVNNNENISTDTIFVVPSISDPSGYVEVYKKRRKPNRLAPLYREGGKVDLGIVKNPPAFIYSRSLDKELVRRLLVLAKKKKRSG